MLRLVLIHLFGCCMISNNVIIHKIWTFRETAKIDLMTNFGYKIVLWNWPQIFTWKFNVFHECAKLVQFSLVTFVNNSKYTDIYTIIFRVWCLHMRYFSAHFLYTSLRDTSHITDIQENRSKYYFDILPEISILHSH